SEVFRIVINRGGRASRIVILSAEQHAHGGIREALRLCSRNKAGDSPFAIGVGKERIPAQSGGYQQPRICFPAVLHKEAFSVSGKIKVQSPALRKRGHSAQLEVCQRTAGEILKVENSA